MYRPQKIRASRDIPHWNKLENGGKGGNSKGVNFVIPKGHIGNYIGSSDIYIFDPVEAMESHCAKVDPDGTIWYVIYKDWRPHFNGDMVEHCLGMFEIVEDTPQFLLL